MKPTVEMTDARIVAEQLYGIVKNHPTLGNGEIVTSFIMERAGDLVETKNTVYKVLSWAVSSSAEAAT